MRILCLILCSLSLLFISGCTTFGTNQKREVQVQEGKKEVTKSASNTDLQTETTKPLVDATGSSGTTITLDIKGELPQEKTDASQKKEASEDTFMSMTIEETWEQFSGWVYLIIAFAALILVRAIKQFESTKTFQVAESSISGGLRVFKSALSQLDGKLVRMDPRNGAYNELKALRDELAQKESSLKAKSRS